MFKCQPSVAAAQNIMNIKKQKDEQFIGQYTLSKNEFFNSKLTSVEDALVVEKANVCMKKCREPGEIIKRVLSSNLKEISENI